jgi:hypothetical protein
MLAAPNIQIAICPACGATLIQNERVVAPHHEISFGIHPAEIERDWRQPLPVIKTFFRFCERHPAIPELMSKMASVLPYHIIGLDMPIYINWLGHWITASRLGADFRLLFNVQIPRRQFLDILCMLPEHYGNLADRAKAYNTA